MQKKNKGILTDLHIQRLQRPDMLYNGNSQKYQQAILALQKDFHFRTPNDIEQMANLLRSHNYFRSQGNEFLLNCCKIMKYELLQKNLVVYKRGLIRTEGVRLCILISGELGIYIGSQELKVEILRTDHFGANMLVLGSDGYADMPDLEIKCIGQCQGCIIDKSLFNPNLLTQEISRVTKEITQLYQFVLFNDISYTYIRKFYAHSFKQCYNCLDIVYTQDQPPQLVYLVVSGIFETRQDKDGLTQSVQIITPGQLLGNQEIIQQQLTRISTAFCISDEAELLIFDSKYFYVEMLPLLHKNLILSPESKTQYKSRDQFRKTVSIHQPNKIHSPNKTGDFAQRKTSQYLELFKKMKLNKANTTMKPNATMKASLTQSINSLSISRRSKNQLKVQNVIKELKNTQFPKRQTNEQFNVQQVVSPSPKHRSPILKYNKVRSTSQLFNFTKLSDQDSLKEFSDSHLQLNNDKVAFTPLSPRYKDESPNRRLRRSISQLVTFKSIKNGRFRDP